MSDYIHPPTFIAELADQYRLLHSARNLVRAKQQGLELGLYFSALKTALKPYEDSEFSEWYMDVNEACMQLFDADKNAWLSQDFDWDYDKYFKQGLTVEQAASTLQQHLLATGWTP